MEMAEQSCALVCGESALVKQMVLFRTNRVTGVMHLLFESSIALFFINYLLHELRRTDVNTL